MKITTETLRNLFKAMAPIRLTQPDRNEGWYAKSKIAALREKIISPQTSREEMKLALKQVKKTMDGFAQKDCVGAAEFAMKQSKDGLGIWMRRAIYDLNADAAQDYKKTMAQFARSLIPSLAQQDTPETITRASRVVVAMLNDEDKSHDTIKMMALMELVGRMKIVEKTDKEFMNYVRTLPHYADHPETQMVVKDIIVRARPPVTLHLESSQAPAPQ